MCEIAIFMVPNNGHPTDPAANAMRYDVGHVVEVQEDGAWWGPGDLQICKVVKYPGVPAEKMAYLTATVPAQSGNLAQRRAIKVAAPASLADTIDPKAMPADQFQAALTVAVARVADPRIVGSDPVVIG